MVLNVSQTNTLRFTADPSTLRYSGTLYIMCGADAGRVCEDCYTGLRSPLQIRFITETVTR